MYFVFYLHTRGLVFYCLWVPGPGSGFSGGYDNHVGCGDFGGTLDPAPRVDCLQVCLTLLSEATQRNHMEVTQYHVLLTGRTLILIRV